MPGPLLDIVEQFARGDCHCQAADYSAKMTLCPHVLTRDLQLTFADAALNENTAEDYGEAFEDKELADRCVQHKKLLPTHACSAEYACVY